MFFRFALLVFGVVCCAEIAPAAAQTFNVTTYHYDNFRSGWNRRETTLTPSNVAGSTFGVVAQTPLDGQVDGQPLILNNVVYVATENNTVYAIDAVTGAIIQSVDLGTPVPYNFYPPGCGNTSSTGVKSTPVIDIALGVMYVVTYTYENSTAVYRVHQLSIPSLKEITNTVISASHVLSDGQTIFNFNASYQQQRAGLLEANGNVYAAFGSFCDQIANQSRGWLLGWTAGTLTPLPANEMPDTQMASQTPSSGVCDSKSCSSFFLSSIWMSGYGIAADSSGNLFFATGNSDGVRTNNLENSAVKLSPNLRKVLDYFTPYDFATYDPKDEDFGSGGVMVVPPQTGSGLPHRAVVAGKEGTLYILDRDPGMMGGYVAGGPDKPASVPIGRCWCGASYFVGSDGVGRIVTSGGNHLGDSIRTYLNMATFPTTYEAESSLPPNVQDPGFFTTVSSNGTHSAIIWAVGRPTSATTPVVTLYAFNGTAAGKTLPLLYSGVAGNWPNVNRNANIVPVVANGRVYVASYQMLRIFGLTKGSAPSLAPLKVAASPLEAAPAGPRIFGTITSVSGDHIVVQLRSKESVSVDLADALKQYESVVPYAGENVEVQGASAPDGSFVASSMIRAKEPPTWGPDRR